MNYFIIEPHTYFQGKKKAKHWMEIAEEEAMYFRMLQEQQSYRDLNNSNNITVPSVGGIPYPFTTASSDNPIVSVFTMSVDLWIPFQGINNALVTTSSLYQVLYQNSNQRVTMSVLTSSNSMPISSNIYYTSSVSRNLPNQITVGGTTFTDTGSTGFSNGLFSGSHIRTFFNPGFNDCTLGCYINFPTSASTTQIDSIYIGSTNGGYTVAQYRINAATPTVALHCDLATGSWVGNLISIPDPTKTYWLTMRRLMNASSSVQLYDADTWTQVGGTSRGFSYKQNPVSYIGVGRNDVHTPLEIVTQSFDNFVVDYTNQKWPLLPVTFSADTTAPTLTYVTTAQTTSLTPFTVYGNAVDPQSGINYVQSSMDGVTYQNATGTTSWTSSVSLTTGGNTVYSYTEDNAGNLSAIQQLLLFYNGLAVLTSVQPTTTNSASIGSTGGSKYWASRYSASNSGNATQIGLQLSKTGSMTNTFTALIYTSTTSGSSIVPGIPMGEFAEFSGSALSSSEATWTATSTGSIPQTSGSVYFIVLRNNGSASNPNHPFWMYGSVTPSLSHWQTISSDGLIWSSNQNTTVAKFTLYGT